MARLSELAGELFAAASSSDRPDLVVATVAGADYPEDVDYWSGPLPRWAWDAT